MGIYDPVQGGSGIYSGGEVGKNVPAMGPFKNFNPKLQGPGSGKIKAAIYAARLAGKYFKRNPRFAARIGAVAGGALVSNYASDNKYRKTLRATKSRYSTRRRYYADKHRFCCCCSNRGRTSKRRM